jgi:hypothetical protein
LEVGQGPVLASLSHQFHGLDVGADILEGKFATHDILHFLWPEKNTNVIVLMQMHSRFRPNAFILGSDTI